MATISSTIELRAKTTGVDSKLRNIDRSLKKVTASVHKANAKLGFFGKVGTQSVDRVRKSVGGLNKSFQDATKRLKMLQTGLRATAGLAAAVLGGTAVKSAANFGKSMSAVRAVIGTLTDKEMKGLNAEARKLGKTTMFTAGQAAEGMEMLAMAGLNAQQVIAATSDSLALAAAGALTLRDAADISTNVMSGFSLGVEELTRVTDVMAKTASSSNTSVAELGEALSYVGPVAAQSGLSLELTNAAIGTLGTNGIKASRAGTAIRGMLLKLQDTSPKTTKILDRLGVSVRDKAGDFREFSDIMKEIGERTKDAGDYAGIFGRIASSGAAVIAKAAASGELQTFAESLKDAAGAAKEMADIRLDNLSGDVTKLTSAWDGLGLTMVTGEVSGFLRGIIQDFTVIIQFMEALASRWPALTAGIVKFTGAVVALGLSFLLLGKRITLALGPIGLIFAAAMSSVKGFQTDGETALARLEWAWTGFINGLKSYSIAEAFEDVRRVLHDVGDWFYELYDRVIGHSYIPDLVDGIEFHFARLKTVMVAPVVEAAKIVEKTFKDLSAAGIASLDEMMESTFAEDAKARIKEISVEGKRTYDSLEGPAKTVATIVGGIFAVSVIKKFGMIGRRVFDTFRGASGTISGKQGFMNKLFFGKDGSARKFQTDIRRITRQQRINTAAVTGKGGKSRDKVFIDRARTIDPEVLKKRGIKLAVQRKILEREAAKSFKGRGYFSRLLFGGGVVDTISGKVQALTNRTHGAFTKLTGGGLRGLGKLGIAGGLLFGAGAVHSNIDKITSTIDGLSFDSVKEKVFAVMNQVGMDGLMTYMMFGAPGAAAVGSTISRATSQIFTGMKSMVARVALILAPVGASILSGPAGWVALGATAAAVGAYSYWDDLKPAFEKLWADIKAWWGNLNFTQMISDSFKRAKSTIANTIGGPFAGQGKGKGFANGGFVSGAGTGTSDDIPARLSNGEFVVNAKMTRKHKALLEMMNANRFAKGGAVGGGGVIIGADGRTIDIGKTLAQFGESVESTDDSVKDLVENFTQLNDSSGNRNSEVMKSSSLYRLVNGRVEKLTSSYQKKNEVTGGAIQALEGLSESVSAAETDLQTLTGLWANTAQTAMQPIVQALTRGGDLGTAMKSAGQQLVSTIAEKFISQITAPFEKMLDKKLDKIFEPLNELNNGDFSKKTAEDLDNIFSDFGGNLIGIFTDAWDYLFGGLGDTFSSIFSGISGMFGGGSSDGMDGGGSGGIFGSIGSGISGLFGGGDAGYGSDFGGASDGGGFLSGIGDSLGSMFGGITSFLGFASGGVVPSNPESGPSDTIPALLTPGETVIPAGTDVISNGDTAIVDDGEATGAAGAASAGGEGGGSDDPENIFEALDLLMAKQREATAVSASESAARVGIMGDEGASQTEQVLSSEEAKAAAVEAGEATAQASRDKGKVAQKISATAGAIMSTAMGVARALGEGGPFAGPGLAAMMAALGAIQISTIAAAKTGGMLTHDGKVSGAGGATSDSIPAMISDGEYIVNARATRQNLPLLQAINAGKGMQKFAGGGMAGSSANTTAATYNTTHIHISGNVDQRAIDQIRDVISRSPKEVENAGYRGERDTKGIRRPAGR